MLFIELCDNWPRREIFNANMVPHKITPSLCDQTGFMKKRVRQHMTNGILLRCTMIFSVVKVDAFNMGLKGKVKLAH